MFDISHPNIAHVRNTDFLTVKFLKSFGKYIPIITSIFAKLSAP